MPIPPPLARADPSDAAEPAPAVRPPGLALSDRVPDAGSLRAALLVVSVSAGVFVVLAALASRPVTPVSWFIPLFQSVLVVNDLVTAALLFGQLRLTRRRASLVLASGYVFTAVMAGIHMLTFPGVFSPGGLLGAGLQSTGYLHVFWHLGMPAATIAYAVLQQRPRTLRLPTATAIVIALGIVAVLATGLTLLATAGNDLLPPMLRGHSYSSTFNIGRYGQWVATGAAIAVMWRRRRRSVLDLWLLVMLCGSFFEIALVSIFNAGRYDVGFYAGRVYAMLASSVVLVMLLAEHGKIYRELANAQATARSELALRQSREGELLLLQAAISRQNDILVITEAGQIDAPGGPRIVYVNDAFVRRTGYAREEAIGRTPRMLQGAGTDRAELDRIRSALQDWQAVRAELLNYTKSGSPFWLELDIAPMADAAGRYTHWVAVERDVSARKDAEQRARINEERFQLLARATNDVIWDWDLVGDTIWWNDSFETAFGYERASVDPGPASWTGRIHPEDRSRVMLGMRKVIEGTGSRWEDEYRFLSAGGAVLDVIDRGFVIRDEAGKAVRIIGSMVDISEQRRLQAQLRQAQRLDAIGQLTGGVAHDFNNLLTVILGNAELLSERLGNYPSLAGLVQTTLHAAERGAELTSRLLAFARKQSLHSTPTDVAALLGNMHGLLRRTLGEQLDIEWTPDQALWPAMVDGSQLEAAILNICINARDAMPFGGRLALETANVALQPTELARRREVDPELDLEPGDYVVVSVTDTGTGMDEATLARAFEPFFTTKDVGKGSGLGLSMVYGFAKQSRGHVAIETSAGSGTRVRLYLPRAADPGVAPEVPRPATPDTGSETILLVEDDELVRNHVGTLLRTLGYAVHAVARPQEALEALRRRSYHLLFTDIVMPGGMDGWELAREARQLHPAMPLLFTSGYSDEPAGEAVPHDRVQLLKKPYRRQELAAAVRRMLDRAAPSRAP